MAGVRRAEAVRRGADREAVAFGAAAKRIEHDAAVKEVIVWTKLRTQEGRRTATRAERDKRADALSGQWDAGLTAGEASTMAPRSADLTIEDGVAVITLSHPPMNSLHPELMDAMLRAVARAHASPAVRALVLVGEGNNFSAGFDIPTFTQVGERTLTMRIPSSTHIHS